MNNSARYGITAWMGATATGAITIALQDAGHGAQFFVLTFAPFFVGLACSIVVKED